MNEPSKISKALTLLMERKFSKLPPNRPPRRAIVKSNKVANRIANRNQQSDSMMISKHPKGMHHIPLFPDDRTRMLISNHIGRVKDKQDRK